MTDRSSADVDLIDDEFERLGKRAGAELRRQPPPDGPGAVQRTAQRRRATVGAVAAGVTIAIVVAGLVVANSWQDEPAPTATLPPTPVAPTTTLVLEDATPADALRTTTPGTWRAVADPSSLAPEFPAAAVWTGTDVIVIGSNWADSSELSPPSAAAYDVGRDRWRGLADPPPALGQASRTLPRPRCNGPGQRCWPPRGRERSTRTTRSRTAGNRELLLTSRCRSPRRMPW